MCGPWHLAIMPTPATTVTKWAWCRHWYSLSGKIVMTEWRT